jgi:GH15 family glucan-1,4-alpha-glucosidase
VGYAPLSEYSAIGNGYTLALVSRTGSVDWLGLPHLDSPTVFAAILDDRSGGRFAVAPERDFDAVARYRAETNLLDTRFRTRTGEALLTDFFPAGRHARENPENNGRLVRRIQGLSGQLSLRIICDVRFDYGRRPPRWERANNRRWRLISKDRHLLLTASHPLFWEGRAARLRVKEGETVWLTLTWGGESVPDSGELSDLLESTERYWRDWRRAGDTGKYPATGFWRESLDRTALTLKLLQFRPTGAIAAGATAALPAVIHGGRNRDDRHALLREAAATLTALSELGHYGEVRAYLDWVRRVLRESGPEELQPRYRLDRPRPPAGEREMPQLAGYQSSAPVRIGQANAGGPRHFIYGEVLELFFTLSRYVGKITVRDWELIRPLVDRACEVWRSPDYGIWEWPAGPRHFTHSKLMCWVALDRGIKIARHYGFRADLGRWRSERAAVRREILRRGVNKRTGAFRRHFDTDAVDAALLRIPLVDFLPASDRRVAATIRAVESELLRDGVVLRYAGDDAHQEPENGVLICLFWYLRCLIRRGRLDEVETHLRRAEGLGGATGLLGEGFDPVFRQITGNYPQALSHVGYAAAVLEYLEARKAPSPPRKMPWSRRMGLLFRDRHISPPRKSVRKAPSSEPDRELRQVVSRLVGHFYDGHEQRVAYPGIRASAYFGQVRACIAALRGFNPETLATDAERIAFWTNLFNTLVVHAVIELGVRDSIREAPFFFRRAVYTIGGVRYRLGDIEHGVLRGNRRPPHWSFRPFSDADPRLRVGPETPDPRVHFALVRASRTCPPIQAYTPDSLDEQLDTSARVFINATSQLDMDDRTLWVSETFKWYRKDFGFDDADLVRFVARHWYRSDPADWLTAEADRIVIRYLPYDWRLNR